MTRFFAGRVHGCSKGFACDAALLSLWWWQRRGGERGRGTSSEGPIGGPALSSPRGGEDLVAALEQVLLQLG